ncbi:MAG TPA: hypothetical protein PKH79_02080 [Prolixibacteraceae bacterium]|nr:hypothetical protein [Prolixibacteraceae bacterium]
MKKEIYIGDATLKTVVDSVTGSYTKIEGEDFYRIGNYDQMPPFFMTIVSNSDHWMYLSSNGSLTAGRANPENAIFPYYTDDKIHDSAEITGSKTILQVTVSDKTCLWEPFSNRYVGAYAINRNLYKNSQGNKIIFEEINSDLGITFRYCWMNSDRFGWIRKCTLINNQKIPVHVEILDGLQNILPYGVQRTMQGAFSTLLDAYKKCELVENTSLVLYRMSSIPVDRAEPSEALKATTVWSVGLPNPQILVSNRQLDKFRTGKSVEQENESRGIKGAYFIQAEVSIQPNGNQKWYQIAEVCQDASQVASLVSFLKKSKSSIEEIEADITLGTEILTSLVASADGIEITHDQLNAKRHFSNTLFNIMRGGIPNSNYTVDKKDFIIHLLHCNQSVASSLKVWADNLPEKLEYYELISAAEKQGNPDLIRIAYEYLPLKFSRRHGDPSRPWNLFDIKLKNSDGTPSLYYQGNWRDIFQNWEALSVSYPAFLPGMIARFVNASTIDGYNPYKITRDGFDWELLDPSNPWSNIGYWGDHQIIYLNKLLELSERFYPGQLELWLDQPVFTYANVPYRQKPYSELLKSPRDTIRFEEQVHLAAEKKTKETGSDGKLILNKNEVLKVNFTEKLLVPLLSKLSNFIPGAGIWMNTQRPEWNDANNALVGSGASMVTLYYMRRYIHFISQLFSQSTESEWNISEEIMIFFNDIASVFSQNTALLGKNLTNNDRKKLTDELGMAGSRFREKVYQNISGEKTGLSKAVLLQFLQTVQRYIDQSICDNKRPDGLYHAYNLIIFSDNEIGIRHLYEMLEGQVAILSSGYLSPVQVVELLDSLRESSLYRADQRSYILYPDRQLPRFLEKNNLTIEQVSQSELLKTLIADGNYEIISKDINGICHFNGTFNNAEALKAALEKIQGKYKLLAEKETNLILNLYEQLFDHQSFTGRSGTFYKYEGLGCIYWHMVSKLMLAVGENLEWTKKTGVETAVTDRLIHHYDAIREGIGSHKKPEEYGAFPTDPYSHTPSMAGVQQPGMTGQVKEDILSRMMELGIRIENGTVLFDPLNLKKEEFLDDPDSIDIKHFTQKFCIQIPTGKPLLAFSFCGTPVIYLIDEIQKIDIHVENEVHSSEELMIDSLTSRSIFSREGNVHKIVVHFRAETLK